MPKKNNGSKSEDQFVKKLEALYGKKVYIQRITDTKSIKGKMKGTGFAAAAPSDYLITINGIMAYAEVKSCSSKTSFSFSQFTPSQNAAMKKQQAAGGIYWVFIHSLHHNKWFILDGNTILDLRSIGNNSIKWENMEKYECLNLPT